MHPVAFDPPVINHRLQKESQVKNLRDWNKLVEFLNSLPAGKVPDSGKASRAICSFLSDCWDDIPGSDTGKVGSGRLDHIKQLEWNPPDLSFVILRHGGTVMGSSRAELKGWTVDVERRTAVCGPAGHRQIKPLAPRLDFTRITDEIVSAIKSGIDDPRLTWSPQRDWVKVNLAKAIGKTPSQPKETVRGRTKNLRDRLIQILTQKLGWKREGAIAAR
jgi:hypothetical protein